MSSDFLGRTTRLASEPGVFLHQVDLPGRRALLVDLPEAELRRASFLDQRALGGARRDGGWLPLDSVLAQGDALAGRAPQAIFHIGHCGSTLLSRLLDHLPGTLGLREPLVLRVLAKAYETQHLPTTAWSPAQVDRALASMLGLLDRRFEDTRHVVVKATSSCNALVAPWLLRFSEARAVAMHIPLRAWLATILKSPDATADALRFAPSRLAALHTILGRDDLRLHEHGLGEVLALGWIGECARMANLAADAGIAPRLLRLDFEALLADPRGVLARVAAHLGIEAPVASLNAACAAELGRYAKATEHAYSAVDRAADLAESQRRFGAEIESGIALARRLVAMPALARIANELV
ncbi:MAG: sulfotransferase [Xanthomonadaceae bacterium]|nr:sulfotransferase [Xanthomonadaceae bacterium]